MAGRIIIIVLIGICLAGCSLDTTTPTMTPTVRGILTPYLTATPSPTSPPVAPIATIPVTPVPTPTPFLHTIAEKETMLGIAYQYGVTLEELQEANPGVDPHFLSVGKTLIIPLSGEIQVVMPTLTPVTVKLGKPSCHPTGDGGVTCFVEITNNLEEDVENISAWVGINSKNGENITGKVAYTPLNLLRAEQRMPLMVTFASKIPNDFEVQTELLSGIILDQADVRYLDVQANIENIDFSDDGKQAEVKGEVILSGEAPSAAQVWVLAIAYDEAGNPVGMRKWESQGEMNFEITLFSVDGAIDQIDVLAEVRSDE